MVVNQAVARVAGLVAIFAVLAAGCARNDLQEGGRAVVVHIPFDSGAWKADAPGVRAKMAQDLLDRRLLVGKSPAEVKALLGEPDQDGTGFLGYFVYPGAGNVRVPAYAVRVEFDARGQWAQEASVDTDTVGADLDMD